ncbi:MAG: alpha-L-fucosidase, partial [Bacteroidales bacterium]
MRKFKVKSLLLALITMFFLFDGRAQNVSEENTGMDEMWGSSNLSGSSDDKDHAELFEDGNFGMFIHWGLYSHLGGKWKEKTYYGIGEWMMSHAMADIPAEEYMEIAKEFDPENFNARAIAQLAKDAGMKYIIITSKHHEGFAMFNSQHPFNIVDATPFARDPMKELSTACRELGLGFGFYYSHNQDWTEPGGTRGPTEYPEGTPATFEDYFNKKCKPQVIEICSNYGDIDFVWFDTPGQMPKKYVLELVDIVRKLQPDALLCSRVGHGLGDYSSKGDMEVPPRNLEGLWETADTNNDSWSYAWYDKNFKSPKEILHRLVNTVGRGGTYLFNVGPDGKGEVPVMGQQFLREVGKWIQKYPQVIYGAGSSPWGHALAWGDVTTQNNTLYLSVFNWPDDGKLYLPGLESEIVSAEILNGSIITYHKKNGWTVFDVPCESPNSLASVIKVELDYNADTVMVNPIQGIYPNIKTTLLAEFSEVSGAEKKDIRWMEKFGEWKHVNQISKWEENGTAKWIVNVYEPGYY